MRDDGRKGAPREQKINLLSTNRVLKDLGLGKSSVEALIHDEITELLRMLEQESGQFIQVGVIH